MTGTIVTRTVRDGSRRYLAVYRAGGRQVWKTFTRKRDAERHLSDQIKKVNDGAWVDVQPTRMAEVIDRWQQAEIDTPVLAGELKPSYAKSVRSIVKVHIRPAFAEVRSDQLTHVTADWLEALATKQAEGTMSAQTRRHVVRVFGMMTAWAMEAAQRYVAVDPLADYRRRRKRTRHAAGRAEVRCLQPDELSALLNGASGDLLAYTAILVLGYSGLRRGELFGLQWPDIDESAGQIRVRRAVYQGSVGLPKTRSSIRSIDVPLPLLRQLQRYKRAFPPVDERAFIFRAANGSPLDPDNFFKRTFVPLAVKAKLRPADIKGLDERHLIGLHTIRHGYASLLLSAGEPVKYVAAQLGHADVAMTLNTYAHCLRETSSAATARLAMRMPIIPDDTDVQVA